MTVKLHPIEERIAFVILSGQPFSADDITEDGTWSLDPGHQPNGRQSSIGRHLQHAAQRGYIETDGRVVSSCAPHRKGGAIRIWRPTPAGIDWARAIFEQAT